MSITFNDANSKLEQKIVILHNGSLSNDDLYEINSNLFTMTFNHNYHAKSNITELLQRFQCVVIDLDILENRVYFAQNQSLLLKEQNIKSVYMASKGSKIDTETIKKEYSVNFVAKYLPEAYKDAKDFVQKLLNDHISSAEMGLLKKIWKKIKPKCCA